MSDPSTQLTWLQVVDSAVKIGLGALISGIATYWVTKLNHSKEIEKQAILRKKDLIEKISQEFEYFWNAFRAYYLVSLEYIHRFQIGEEIPDYLDARYNSKNTDVREKINNLSTAQSLLLLLDDEASNRILEEFALKTETYITYIKDAANPERAKSIKELKEYHNEVLGIRADFYKTISKLFKKPDL